MKITFSNRSEKSRSVSLCYFVVSLLFSGFVFSSCNNKKVDFSTEVKPILNKRCISCHGGVKRSGEFSLLFREEALDTTESGHPAILPFDAKHSEMIKRLTAEDPEERMPYKEEPLTEKEIEILTRWIDQGAEWGDHWAYVRPKKQEVPEQQRLLGSVESVDDSWIKNEIDLFVLEQLEETKIKPSPRAEPSVLARRVYLDLIGIPPDKEQAEKFINDRNPNSYEKLVDELLASPRFGEKWASWWLDLARYADTKGYERDVNRDIWRYRDWVIKAFNSDMPFDQFTIEQLAGDLLPNATDDQFIATGFHRNTMNNDEGGTDDEEFRVAALLDRVNTTWEVWQSTTMACVQCHTHPYDPFVHEEYYKSMAFFNNTRDEDTYGEHPNLRLYKEPDQQKLIAIKDWVNKHAGPQQAQEVTLFLKTFEPKYHAHDFDEFKNGELIDTKFLGIRSGGSARLKKINLTDKDFLLMNYLAPEGSHIEIYADHIKGAKIASFALPKTEGWKRKVLRIPLKPSVGVHDLYFVFKNDKIKADQPVSDVEWFAFRKNLPGAYTDPLLKQMDSDLMQLVNTDVEKVPVIVENTKDQLRETYVFDRGNWLVKGGVVTPAVPKSLNPFPQHASNDRLGFAKWLTDKNNPLTARTIVNRIWEQLFGAGLVETLEDFGTQGASPSHPELLDWMALRMMNDHNWSIKSLIKEIVMSGTYQQDSRVDPVLYQKDPFNRLLARGPRVRLSAEQVRDQALAIGGLLSEKMYGKSVMPFQPAGIWNSVWSGEYWKNSEGEDQFRRTVYTYIKRTSPYPSIVMFDGSSREVCMSRRIRTNTPLQALVTLNDSTYVIAARAFAKQMYAQVKEPQNQIAWGYNTALLKQIRPEKLKVLYGLYQNAFKTYSADTASVKELMVERSTAEVAALTVVAQAILNLDEVITKE